MHELQCFILFAKFDVVGSCITKEITKNKGKLTFQNLHHIYLSFSPFKTKLDNCPYTHHFRNKFNSNNFTKKPLFVNYFQTKYFAQLRNLTQAFILFNFSCRHFHFVHGAIKSEVKSRKKCVIKSGRKKVEAIRHLKY